MRATSPLDPIQYLGNPVELPKPRFAVGTKVRYAGAYPESDVAWYSERVVRELLQDTRRIVDGLRRQGFSTGSTGQWLPPFNKEQIRLKLRVMQSATSMEVAGHKPNGMHVVGTLGNQCYLQNGQCHSGVDYSVYLLFRAELDGNKVVYIHPHPIARESGLAQC